MRCSAAGADRGPPRRGAKPRVKRVFANVAGPTPPAGDNVSEKASEGYEGR